MLSFFDMIGTYEQRKVRNDKTEEFILDTASVTDREWIYETAVAHKDFNNGDWIILEGTNSKESAVAVHEKWLNALSSGVDSLTDIFDERDYTRK